jgi:hypothetical protein
MSRRRRRIQDSDVDDDQGEDMYPDNPHVVDTTAFTRSAHSTQVEDEQDVADYGDIEPFEEQTETYRMSSSSTSKPQGKGRGKSTRTTSKRGQSASQVVQLPPTINYPEEHSSSTISAKLNHPMVATNFSAQQGSDYGGGGSVACRF